VQQNGGAVQRSPLLSQHLLQHPAKSRPTIQRLIVNQLDTNNPVNNDKLFLDYRWMDIGALYDTQKAILNEMEKKSQGVNIENARLHVQKITESIKHQMNQAIESATQAQGTIVVSGNIQLDDEILGWSPIAKAGKTPEPNEFKMTPSVIGEYRISQNDAEGKALTFLYKIIKSNVAKISFGKHLQINIQGTYGPCNGCKDRIKLFVQEISKLIQSSHVLGNPLGLWINVLYVNPPLSKVRGTELKTVYGWTDDHIRAYDSIEPIERFTHTEAFIIKPIT